MITIKIDITTKKGTTVPTTWGIWQSRPYPSFDSRLDWQNAGGLFKAYHEDKAKGIGREYHCALLRNDRTDWTGKDRTDYAGFKPYNSGHVEGQAANPGSFAYRGNDLGEITGSFAFGGGWSDGYVNWNVRGSSGGSTPSERDFLNEAVKPALLAAVETHKDALKVEAVAALREYVVKQVTEAREQLDKAEKTMAAAIAAL